MRRIVLFVCLLSAYSLGQGGAATGIPTITNTRGEPVPYATVAVCVGYPGAVPSTPCGTSTLATIDTDLTLTKSCTNSLAPPGPISGTGCSNPGKSDGLGNIVAFATPGLYWCQYSGGSIIQPLVTPCFFANGTGGGIPFACASAVNGSIVGMTSPTTSSCDPNGITDFIGHWTSQSYRATGAFNGTVELTGGLADPTNAPDTNSVAFLAPLTVPTPYYLRPPASTGTVGQCLQLLTQDSGTNGIIDALQWATCASSSGSVTSVGLALPSIFTVTNSPVTTSGTLTGTFNNAGADYLPTGTAANTAAWELINGGSSCGDSSHAVSYDTSTHKFGCQAISTTSVPQALNPTAPTLANQNAAGARSITYGIQGCEDGPTCAYHSTLVTATIANANAVPSVLLTAYGDTLYGYRCYNIYVTADSGARTGVPGLIANCVWKKYLDTGTNGNSIAATNTNTTALDPFGLTIPLPGCNSIPKAPSGIDGPPCVPKAEDDEFTSTFGFGDAADPAFAGLNLGTSTATLTNGELIFTPQNVNAQNQARLLCMPTYPSTPYTFVAAVSTVSGGAGAEAGIAVTDGTKLLSWAQGSNSIDVGHWTNINNNFSSAPINITITHDQGLWTYLKLQDTGTNIVYSHSFDGVNYYQDLSEGRTSFLTPAKFCLYGEGSTTFTPQISYDYLRRTQ